MTRFNTKLKKSSAPPSPATEAAVRPETKLLWVKLAHTVIWAFFAACILAIPLFTLLNRPDISGVLIAIVFLEVLTLILNRMKCPLTGVAARYTSERKENFDIFLPLWLAKYNKEIFGALYVAGAAYTLLSRLIAPPAA